MRRAVFITGTGTDIGKTYVTGLIVKKLRDAGLDAGYYKAALSGAEPDENGVLQPGDALHVNETAGIGDTIDELVSYIYREAVSPHLAARINNNQIDFDKVEHDFKAACDRHEYITMEGSGGIICPLRWDSERHVILDDLVKRLGLSVLIVADAGLVTINNAVLTVEHLRSREIPIRGFILNHFHPGDVMEEDNLHMIEEMTGVPVIACVKPNDKELDIDASHLAALYD